MRLTNILHTNWLATLRLNLHAGGWRAVMRMPIRVFGPLRLTLQGRVLLPADAPRGTVIIGSTHEDYTAACGKAELRVLGTWHVGGLLRIGPDACLLIARGAELHTGAHVFLGRDTQVHCYGRTTIADGVFAGETYVCDSTMHRIVDGGTEKPICGEVTIGEGSYLGQRTIILKGTHIPPRSVVGSGSVCSRDYREEGSGQLFLCGNPAIVKKHGVSAIF